MNYNSIRPVLHKIDRNARVFKHMARVVSFDEFSRFHNYERDLFKLSERGKALGNYCFTVKDVFNTYLFNTEMGSILWQGHQAGNNARVISQLLWEGARFVGKTVTSEFAVHEETYVVNPNDASRSCGTSSAGSAVSVYLEESDFSLATQTGGSIGRPASYVGVKAFKPSYGVVSRTGVLKTCDPFDTVGYFVRDFEVAKDVSRAIFLTGKDYPQNQVLERILVNRVKPKLAVFNGLELPVSHLNQIRFAELKTSLSVEYDLVEIDWPAEMQNINMLHRLIYTYSLYYYFSNELTSIENISQSFLNEIAFGKKVTAEQFMAALKDLERLRKKFDDFFIATGCDFFIQPATYGVAPLLGAEEHPDFNNIGNMLGLPMCYLPFKTSEGELPSSFIIGGRRFSDYAILSVAHSIGAYV